MNFSLRERLQLCLALLTALTGTVVGVGLALIVLAGLVTARSRLSHPALHGAKPNS